MAENPEFREKLLSGLKKLQDTPEYKQQKAKLCRERNKIMNKTPEHSMRGKAAMEKLRSNPGFAEWVNLHAPKLTHIRWHVNRGIVKEGCKFCAGGQ